MKFWSSKWDIPLNLAKCQKLTSVGEHRVNGSLMSGKPFSPGGGVYLQASNSDFVDSEQVRKVRPNLVFQARIKDILQGTRHFLVLVRDYRKVPFSALFQPRDQTCNLCGVLPRKPCRKAPMAKFRSAAYRSQGKRHFERQSHSLNAMLKAFAHAYFELWDQTLSRCTLAFSSAIQQFTYRTPHFLWAGRRAGLSIDY